MYIGSLFAPESQVQVKFSSFHIGSQIPFPSEDLPDGKGWGWKSLLDTGVDLRIELDRSVFADELTFTLSQESGVSKIELFSFEKDQSARLVGHLDAGFTGCIPGGQYTIPIGVEFTTLCIRFTACLKDICLTKLDLTGSVWDAPILYPVPAKTELTGGTFASKAFTSIILQNYEDEDLLFTAKELGLKLTERTSLSPEILAPGATPKNGAIILAKDSACKSEGYTLRVSDGKLSLAAADRHGLIYGIETAVQLLSEAQIPACCIEDAPRMQFRGFHLGLPPREDFGFFKRLIRSLLAPMGYNTLFLQVTAGMQFDRHPEINEAWLNANTHAKNGEWPKLHHGDMVADGCILTKDEVRELAAYARSYGLEVIPEIHSLSHVQYITLAHPELAEIDPDAEKDVQLDTRLADQPPASFYKHSCCPQNEDYYRILFDIIDEVTEVIQPKEYVHMGHDEVYQIGICPKCRDKDPADLLALHINRVHDYLAQKGYKMMMWADMLQPDSGYKTPPAISKIPNDITMLDFIWYFHPELDLEDNLLPYGFPVIMGNMYSSHYTRYDTRIVKPGMVGAQVSCWCRSDEAILGREGKLYDLLFSANMLWSEAYRTDTRATWNRMVCRLLPAIRSALHGSTAPSIMPGAKIIPLLPEGSITPPDPVLTQSLAQVGSIDFRGTDLPVSVPAYVGEDISVRIPVAADVRSLLFGLSALCPLRKEAWEEAPELAVLTITFADGSTESRTLRYAQEIGLVSRRYGAPMPHPYYRHTGYQATYFSDPILEGKTITGDDLTIYGWEWINESGKPVDSVTIQAAPRNGGEMLLACAAAIR